MVGGVVKVTCTSTDVWMAFFSFVVFCFVFGGGGGVGAGGVSGGVMGGVVVVD